MIFCVEKIYIQKVMKRVWRKYNYQQVSQYKRAKLKFRTSRADKTCIYSNHIHLDYVGLRNLKQI